MYGYDGFMQANIMSLNKNTSPHHQLSLFTTSISCRQTTKEEEYVEALRDFNEQFSVKSSGTYVVRAQGNSLDGAGIFDGDCVLIDRSIAVLSGHIILVVVNQEFLLRRFIRQGEREFLISENPSYKPIEITGSMNVQFWGVAIHCIHPLE